MGAMSIAAYKQLRDAGRELERSSAERDVIFKVMMESSKEVEKKVTLSENRNKLLQKANEYENLHWWKDCS